VVGRVCGIRIRRCGKGFIAGKSGRDSKSHPDWQLSCTFRFRVQTHGRASLTNAQHRRQGNEAIGVLQVYWLCHSGENADSPEFSGSDSVRFSGSDRPFSVDKIGGVKCRRTHRQLTCTFRFRVQTHGRASLTKAQHCRQ